MDQQAPSSSSASREELRARLRKKLGQQKNERVGTNARTRKKMLAGKDDAGNQSAKNLKSPAYMADQMRRNPKAMLKKLGVSDPNVLSQLTQMVQQQDGNINPAQIAEQLSQMVNHAVNEQPAEKSTAEGLPSSFL